MLTIAIAAGMQLSLLYFATYKRQAKLHEQRLDTSFSPCSLQQVAAAALQSWDVPHMAWLLTNCVLGA